MTATPKGDLRDQLNKSMFFPISERCICIVYVNDLTKKKKDERNVYLAANIVTEPEIQPVIHYMKLSEKTHEFKIKSTVLLKNVRSIDGRGEEPLRFDLEANKTHRLQCDNPIDKNNILLILYKLSNQYLRTGPSPSFQNFKFPDEITSVSVAQENVFEDFRNYQAITDDEQNRLLSLCSEWNIDLKDADVLMEKMVKTLVELDSANVNTIMRAEEDTLNMMNKLDDTIGDLTKIEDKLSNFEARFDLVADAVKVMSDKDTLIQLERTNRARLEQLIQLIIDTIYIPQNELELLDLAAETDFSDDENLKKCLSIANRLLAACHVVFPDSLEQSMNAISETKSDLNRFRQSFGKRVSKFLSSLIVKTISSENVGPFVEMELPNHGEVFTRLLRYSELCKWLSIADFEATVQLSKVYKMCMAPKYDKEITKFVESAKNAASREYNAKRHHSGSTFSIDGIFGKQVIGRGRSESITLSSKSMDPFMSLPRSKHLRKAASIIMDRVLDQIVSHLSEQLRFFIGFFDSSDDPISNRSTFIDDFQESIRAKIEIISSPPAVSSSSSDQRPVTTTSSLAGSTETQSIEKSLKSGDLGSSGGKTDDQSTMLLRTLMASLYSSLGNELQSLLLFLINMDHFNCLYLFVHISNQSRRTSPTENYFTNKLIAGLLINAKRSMDRFTEEICGAIAQFKITRNRSVGILPFVSFLKDFIEEAEEAFEGSTRRIDLDRVYAKIVAAIFSKIRSASKIDNVAVPDEIICIENFHQLQHIIRSSKVASLEGERKSAEELYLRYKEHFVNKYFGKPFKGMYIFFDKIEQKVVAGIKPSDIQFQSELSVAHLKKLIRDNPWSEVTKGLDLLHRQLETQISNNSSLSQVIWRDIQELLLLQYTHYGKLMRKCYPDSNVRLNFTEQDIVQYFSSSSNFRDQSDGVAEL